MNINFKSIIIFLLLDFLWISNNINTYNNLALSIQNELIFFDKNKLFSLIFTYLFLLYGLNNIVIPYNIPIGFGLVVYGVYSFTNYTLFKNYPLKLVIIDTLWGAILYYVSNKYK